MISETLRNLSRQIAAWSDDGGVRLDRAACDLLSGQLDNCADQVAILEGAPVPPAQRGTLRVIVGGRVAGGAA
jgi:hypothetical protein